MPLSPDHKKKLLDATVASATAFLEDILYLRELIAQLDQTRGEIRRASAILRRLLVEGDLAAIAAPRIGKITLGAPDNNPAYKAVTPETVNYFVSGGTQLFGILLRAAMSAHPSVQFKDFDAERIIQLRIDNFLTQRVLFWKGAWISRAAIIKYVANIAQGVHSGAPQTDDEKRLADARYSLVIGRRGKDGIGIASRPPGQIYDEKRLDFSAAAIDLLLIEMFAAARYLVESPSIITLESVVQAELNQDAGA